MYLQLHTYTSGHISWYIKFSVKLIMKAKPFFTLVKFNPLIESKSTLHVEKINFSKTPQHSLQIQIAF